MSNFNNLKPLFIQKIPLKQIFDHFPLPNNFLNEYLRLRPGILTNTDIFYENSRSDEQPPEYKNFSLFKETDKISSEVIYICPIYLELYEYNRGGVLQVIKHLSKIYKSNRVVFQWNHDIDFASKYLETEKFENVYVINFNTSKPIKNDILAPFWTINTKYKEKEHKYFAGLICNINNGLRKILSQTIYNKKGYYQASNLPYNDFLERVSECTFSLCPRGQGLNSYRFYECFHMKTIPVLFANKTVLPFQSEINYNDICVRIPESKANDFNYIHKILKEKNVSIMLENIAKTRHKFTLRGVQEEIHRRLS